MTLTEDKTMKVKDVQPDLLPCPFCGGLNIGFEVLDDGWKFVETCRTCKARSPVYRTMVEALKGWNTRARPEPAQPTEDLVETAREAAIADFKKRYQMGNGSYNDRGDYFNLQTFKEGFDAGFAQSHAAEQWKAIKTEDDLPKDAGHYLVTSRWDDEDGTYHVCEDYWTGNDWERAIDTLSSLAVAAWMPLPKPYEPDTEEGKR